MSEGTATARGVSTRVRLTTRDIREIEWFLSAASFSGVSGLKAQNYEAFGNGGGASEHDRTTDEQIKKSQKFRRIEEVVEAMVCTDGGAEAWRILSLAYAPKRRKDDDAHVSALMPRDYSPEIAAIATETTTARTRGAELVHEHTRDEAIGRALWDGRTSGLSPMACAMRAYHVFELVDGRTPTAAQVIAGARRALAASATKTRNGGKRRDAEFVAAVHVEADQMLSDASARWRAARASLGIRHIEDAIDERERERSEWSVRRAAALDLGRAIGAGA